jgi:hypothetical protein
MDGSRHENPAPRCPKPILDSHRQVETDIENVAPEKGRNFRPESTVDMTIDLPHKFYSLIVCREGRSWRAEMA